MLGANTLRRIREMVERPVRSLGEIRGAQMLAAQGGQVDFGTLERMEGAWVDVRREEHRRGLVCLRLVVESSAPSALVRAYMRAAGFVRPLVGCMTWLEKLPVIPGDTVAQRYAVNILEPMNGESMAELCFRPPVGVDWVTGKIEMVDRSLGRDVSNSVLQ
jgi:hypothetical protein